MKLSEIKQAITGAIAICSAYLRRPEGGQERLQLDLAASNIAALFDAPDSEPAQIRSLVLQAAVLARVVVTRLRNDGRESDKAVLVNRAVVTWEAALLELEREVVRLPEEPS